MLIWFELPKFGWARVADIVCGRLNYFGSDVVIGSLESPIFAVDLV